MRVSPLLVCLLVSAPPLWSEVHLPALISDHMVLQKAEKVPLWGWADPGEEVTVTLNGQTARAQAGQAGKWRVQLDLRKSPQGPFDLTVAGKNTITVRDVVVGEVWLASGQSNMEWILEKTIGATEEIARAVDPMLRVFTVLRSAVESPAQDVRGSWEVCTPLTAGQFTSIGYYFAKAIRRETKSPVGILHSSWGGTPVEAWISQDALQSVPDLKAGGLFLREQLKLFPERSASYAAAVEKWAKETDRQDLPTPDVRVYAGDNVSPEGWTTFKVPPGKLEGMPWLGIIWLRKEIMLPADASASPFRLDFKEMGDVESVYWNGKLLNEYTLRNFPGRGYARQFYVPSGSVKEGRNVLAFRVYSPLRPVALSSPPRAGLFAFDGLWQARAERAFPPIDASLPPPPDAPLRPQEMPAYCFNGMIAPLIPYAIRGTVWYQGEANTRRAFQYRTALPLLINDWRTRWDEGDFPFYICQLANFAAKAGQPAESAWAELREAQNLTALQVPNSGLAVLIDLGDKGDVHPRNKMPVGDRLARIALFRDYGKSIPFSGPLFQSAKIEKGAIRVTFIHADGGLVAQPMGATYVVSSRTGATAPLVRNSPDSPLEGFQICGADKAWFWADARIVGDSVVVSSPRVPDPIAVRYAWSDNPTCNLANGAGLPAVPFRTDDFPPSTVAQKFGIPQVSPTP